MRQFFAAISRALRAMRCAQPASCAAASSASSTQQEPWSPTRQELQAWRSSWIRIANGQRVQVLPVSGLPTNTPAVLGEQS